LLITVIILCGGGGGLTDVLPFLEAAQIAGMNSGDYAFIAPYGYPVASGSFEPWITTPNITDADRMKMQNIFRRVLMVKKPYVLYSALLVQISKNCTIFSRDKKLRYRCKLSCITKKRVQYNYKYNNISLNR